MCVPTYAGGSHNAQLKGGPVEQLAAAVQRGSNGCWRASVAPALLWRPVGTLHLHGSHRVE
jgi:hypothetical protein